MFQAVKLAAAGATTLLCLCSAVLAEFIANPDFTKGDAERGKYVYQHKANCFNCHGWAGDGESGRNPLSHAAAANLRETRLTRQGLYDVIRCGIPGTQMPYHDHASYRDRRCFGKVMSDFDPGTAPVLGKSLRDKDIVDVIAYLEKYLIGHGKPNYEECALYYGASAGRACAYLKGKS